MLKLNEKHRRKISPWIRICRPIHAPITAGGAVLAIYVLGGAGTLVYLCVALIAVLTISATIMWNDVLDLEEDRINRPERPLPRGELETHHVTGAAFIFFILAIMISAPLGFFGTAATFGIIMLCIFYNMMGKERHIYGNISVATCTAAVLWYPMVITGVYNLWPLAIGIFLIELSRELMITCQDVGGDWVSGRTTLPVKIGVGATIGLAFAIYLLSIPFLFWILNPYLGAVYEAFMTVFVLVLGIGFFQCYTQPNYRNFQIYFRDIAKLVLVGLIFSMLIEVVI